MERSSITRQAAIRLIFSLGLFVLLLGISSYKLYSVALQKSAHERAEDLATFYQTRLMQLDRDWELQARDFKVRLEVTRLLEDKKSNATNIQAFMTVQGTNRRFQYMLIQDRLGKNVFSFGTDLDLEKIPLSPDEESGWYHDRGQSNLYRVFVVPIWLGEAGTGRLAIFYEINNSLLYNLATPGIRLTVKSEGIPIASSYGQKGLENAKQPGDNEIDTEVRDVPWTTNNAEKTLLSISAPIKVLFTTAELAVGAATIPLIDGLILWFTLGFWLIHNTHRVKALSGAVHEFTHNRRFTKVLEENLKIASGRQNDEISDVSGAIQDMTELSLLRDREREEVDHQRRIWSLVFASSNEAIIVTDANNNIIAANPALTLLTGYTEADVVGRNPKIFSSGLQPREFYESMWQQILTVGHWSGELQDKRKDGTFYPKWLNVSVVLDSVGNVTNYIGIFQDITKRKQAEESLSRSETKFRTLYDSSSDAVMLMDEHGFIDCNKSTLEMFGLETKEDFCTKQPTDLSPLNQPGGTDSETMINQYVTQAMQGDSIRFDWMYRRCDGELFHAEVHLNPMKLDGALVLQATVRDITQRIQSEEEIKQLAFYDSLTRLPNRRLLMDRLQHSLSANIRNEKHGAIMFVDLDNFKVLNDTKGHSVGDLLLIEVAHRLKDCVREEDTVARLGGDEFVLLLENLSTTHNEASAHAERVAQKVLQELNLPYHLNGLEHHSSPSIGVTMFCDHSTSVDDLIRHADSAMYLSKQAGRNTVRFYDPETQKMLEARSELEDDLRHALVNQQLQLYYQVQVDIDAHAIGAEVLLRWNHPKMGIISPLQFIPLAEETGLIVPIGAWVMQTACAQLKKWEDDPLTRDLVLAVNVSVRQFREKDFVAQVKHMIQQCGINPSRLKVEITESMIVNNVEATINTMHELNALGLKFSMDDFGTGYSSLSIIKRLPLDQIKIDQSFVRDLQHDDQDKALVRTIIAMAGSMDLSIIAEGVETEEQRQLLASKGCNNYQGYLFSKPVPIEQFEELIKTRLIATTEYQL